MKGYKVFNPDWTCKGFKYEVKNFDMIVARQHCIPCKREFKDLNKKKCEHCLWRDSEYITRLGKGGKRGDFVGNAQSPSANG